MGDRTFIRKPVRMYPLPKRLKDLDEPHPECIKARFARVDRLRDGHDPDEDPTRITRNHYRTVLDRM